MCRHPLRLRVCVPRYRCTSSDCSREVFAHNTSRLARPGWSTTRRCARYILRRLMIDRATVAAVARELGLSWDTVNTIAMDATAMIVAADTKRLDGVRVIGVDEHRWSYTRRSGRGRLRHGDHRSDPRPGGHGAGAAARPGGRLAGRPVTTVPRPGTEDLGDAGQRQNSGSAVLVSLRPIGCTISFTKGRVTDPQVGEQPPPGSARPCRRGAVPLPSS